MQHEDARMEDKFATLQEMIEEEMRRTYSETASLEETQRR